MKVAVSPWKVIGGLAALYLLWGSTFLGIKFAVESLPPFLMGGGRYLVAGLILLVLLRWRGLAAPDRRDWRQACISGGLLLVGGNGLVTWGQQQQVSSGVAALLIATTPLWMVLIEWGFFRGPRPSLLIALGMTLGFAGAVLLIPLHSFGTTGPGIWPILAIAAAPITWCLGSLQARGANTHRDPLLMAALQMICGGGEMLVAGTLRGEWLHFDPGAVSLRSWGAFLYLGLFGSLIGFTTYTWLLRHASPAAVATYAYVNPLVAVLLAWLLGGETPDGKMGVAAALIVGAVVLTTAFRAPQAVPAQEGEPSPPEDDNLALPKAPTDSASQAQS